MIIDLSTSKTTAFVKQITGDKRLKARFTHKDFFEFPRQFPAGSEMISITDNPRLPVASNAGQGAQ